MYYRYHTEPLGSASPVLGVMRGDVRGRLATTEALSYILQRPIRSVQYCEYVLYRMYYRYHTERRNSLSAPLRPYMRTPSRLRYRGPFVACKYCESTTHPVYHAKITVSTKNFPRSEGRKCGVKGLDQWRGLMVWSSGWQALGVGTTL